MASLYVPSRLGSPINAGAKLYFYQTGTTTPQNTYSDSALTTPNANPVVADSNGLFGPIYLLATPDYKAILKDSSGTTIWTTDPLLVANASVITTRGDLIVGNSSALPGRLPIGSAATYLRSDGTDPSWHTLAAADLTGSIAVARLPAGTIIQSVLVTTNAYTTHTTVIPYDDTIPQIGEGDLLLTASITPTTTATRVRVSVLIQSDSGVNMAQCALFRGAVSNALAAAGTDNGTDALNQLVLEFEDVPGSVSAQSYTVRVGPESGTMAVNGTSGSRKYGGVLVSSIRLEEIVA